jgi:hypothetical protein
VFLVPFKFNISLASAVREGKEVQQGSRKLIKYCGMSPESWNSLIGRDVHY